MRRIILFGVAAALLGCDDSGTRPPEPGGEIVDVDGFRMVESGETVFEWKESDPLEADTLEMTWSEPRTVRLVWTGESGDSVAPPDNAQFAVTTADDRFVRWEPLPSEPFTGTFFTGGYPEVETSFRVFLWSGSTDLVSTTDLILHVSP